MHPSTWDGPEADRRIALALSMIEAQETARDWIAEQEYPYTGGGHWVPVISEIPTGVVLWPNMRPRR